MSKLQTIQTIDPQRHFKCGIPTFTDLSQCLNVNVRIYRLVLNYYNILFFIILYNFTIYSIVTF